MTASGYPLSNYNGSAPIALGAAGTDRVFACPALSGDRSLAQWVPTYAYEFNDEHGEEGGSMRCTGSMCSPA